MDMKPSFFRRSADADNERPERNEIDEQFDDEPRQREYTPRPARPAFQRDDRGNRPSRDGRSSDRNARPPRGERPDFRKDENRKPRPAEEREAPENVIYGIHPIREAIEMGKPIEKIYFRRSSAADDARYEQRYTPNYEALDSIRDMIAGTDIISQDVPPEKLDRLSRRGNHQGVVAVIPAIEYADFNDLVERLSTANVPPLVIVMDSVTDVRNFGAIARSAECAGADAIIMSAKNSAPVNGEAMRSSAGALSIIPVCRVGSLRNSLKTLQLAGMQLVAATEKADKIVFEADLTKPTVIIMGSEDKGISGEVLKMCDAKVSIPLLGKIESLNVSAAASVLLFEAVRQRFMSIE